MPRFQLEVAISLAATALLSIAIALLPQKQEGKVQLPTDIHDGESLEKDPFDVVQPEDLIHGTPLHEEAFWGRVRIWKAVLAFLLAAPVVLNAILLVVSISSHDKESVISDSLYMAYALWTFSVASWSVGHRDDLHVSAVYHLFGLTSMSTFLLFVLTLLPTHEFTTSAAPDWQSLRLIFWYSVLGDYALSWVLVLLLPTGPHLHIDSGIVYPEKTLMKLTNKDENNVTNWTGASLWDTFVFTYVTKVVGLANVVEVVEIADLPLVSVDMRAVRIYSRMRAATRRFHLHIGSWRPKRGSGWNVAWVLVCVNWTTLIKVMVISTLTAVAFYGPYWFLEKVILYLEGDPLRLDRRWGWVFCAGLFFSRLLSTTLMNQMVNVTITQLYNRMQVQLNTTLFAKTLVRKDVQSTGASAPKPTAEDAAGGEGAAKPKPKKNDDEEEFASKAQIMTLMTTDVDRVASFAMYLFSLIDYPIEIFLGTIFLYKILGVSALLGLATTCLLLPINHFAGKAVVGTQKKLMKARDERVSLLNEMLGAIRMLKFMGWERSFEERVMKIRDRELKYQRLTFYIEVLFNAVWIASPMLVIIVSFGHYTIIREQVLTPAVAFTALNIFNEMKGALNALPETFIKILQVFVSLRRVEKYLDAEEIQIVAPKIGQREPIILQSATITWPQVKAPTGSAPSTPANRFMLMDLSLNFPLGELSLISGKLGSGKSLLLLGLLGEADVVSGQLSCPRTPPNFIPFAGTHPPVREEDWIVDGACAYVPQTTWLRNASIKDNILFELPYVEERYQKTLEVCALLSDLAILEDGDMSEVGERGINLSGGQKARLSLARAVYSRASLLLLDDVLSAVDAHTARHLYNECLKGDLMRGRTVILVSHHVQLCYPGASYIVALDNGRVLFQGEREEFKSSPALSTLVHSHAVDESDEKEDAAVTTVEAVVDEKASSSEGSTTVAETDTKSKPEEKKAPRKLIDEEKRATGFVDRHVWLMYVKAAGGLVYWIILVSFLILAALGPVFDNGWLRIWSGAAAAPGNPKGPVFYLGIYAAITGAIIVLLTGRWFVLYHGTIRASSRMFRQTLEAVLFTNVRFHDTTSRGRLLNRFGKDFESVDSGLPDQVGNVVMYGLSVMISFITIGIVGGPIFIAGIFVLLGLSYKTTMDYSKIGRDLRRLMAVARSPLFSAYGETIAGVTTIRAFGASGKFLRDMLRLVDTRTMPSFWVFSSNRWLMMRFSLLATVLVGLVASLAVWLPSISASLAAFTLTFALSVTYQMFACVQRLAMMEQSMVAVERIKEFTELESEGPEFVEPRPPAAWPTHGVIKVENLTIRYAPELPNVLHELAFEVRAGEKVGVLGRTGSGKSTLALSFFRFVEPVSGSIVIDDIDITKIGLTDLRRKLTIIPQDPTILSGTIRSMLDVFNEYEDAEIYEALRRVHLIPSADAPEVAVEDDAVNVNVFRNLDSPVSEGGENFSTGERQLLCMARAILKRSKVVLMDEATASVDYATDELISKTIREEFADSTILTIAHRLRTVIDYDRIMLLDNGRIAEFDTPATLLADPNSKFHGLCKATGKNEFAVLKKMAGVA